ncbi:hypothetical protein CCYA_CCYA18G4563 [Cyanidiococcus yangmingshanensis]|nr:hypothetical protein CCYA_CCYA18G4563 [Cyanidiococcus yangmingshanensis]
MQLTLFSASCAVPVVIKRGDFISLCSVDSHLARSVLYSLAARAALFTTDQGAFRVFVIDGECLSGVGGVCPSLRERLWRYLHDQARLSKRSFSSISERISISGAPASERYIDCLSSILQLTELIPLDNIHGTPGNSKPHLSPNALEGVLGQALSGCVRIAHTSCSAVNSGFNAIGRLGTPIVVRTPKRSFVSSAFSSSTDDTRAYTNDSCGNSNSGERILILIDGFETISVSAGTEYSQIGDHDPKTEFLRLVRLLLSRNCVSIVCCDSMVLVDDSRKKLGGAWQETARDGLSGHVLKSVTTKHIELLPSSGPGDPFRIHMREFEPPGSLAVERDWTLTEPKDLVLI